MRSRRTRLLAILVLNAAALIPGAAVFVHEAGACSLHQPESPVEFVAESEVIVIGEVTSAGESLVLRPEAFLKGPVSSEPIRFSGAEQTCPRAELAEGDRALIYMTTASDPAWPLSNQAYVLKDGRAKRPGEMERLELEVVSTIRNITGQYAVPALNDDEGAGINWGDTIVPLGAVLLVIFVIGLILMRVWHRIDPS